MLTAAVRDLHLCYPSRFKTDVRTSCHELWLNNPNVSPIEDEDTQAVVLDCWYPLIREANKGVHHCLEGFVEFLNSKLGIRIQLSSQRGDIHLSAQERRWYSQVHELTKSDIPFWIIDAGGKYDVTVKWWSRERYQKVVDHFRGRIQFVQIGQAGHHHPRLEGVIDLRGRTSVRQLIRLVYHAQGVVCPITGLMHLAAAVPLRKPDGLPRACVVIAGGREPVRWEAYPGHQFIHTIGALDCCSTGGCWKDRTIALGDGNKRDRPGRRCQNVSNELPRCMDMITAEDVIRRIETYFLGGALRYLTPKQNRAAALGVSRSDSNEFDLRPLNLPGARAALDGFLRTEEPPRPGYAGSGIVICAGGPRYFPSAWVCINMLRKLGCRLPVELWHLGQTEVDSHMAQLVAPLGVECIDAIEVSKQHPVRKLGGWELKPFAMLFSRFQEVLLLDADNVPVRNPEYLFEDPEFQRTGAVFWPDYNHGASQEGRKIWRSCRLRVPDEKEFESGQILVDKSRRYSALRLALWFNEHSDFYYKHVHGDKETFHLAFRKLRQPYTLVTTPIRRLKSTMCQHDLQGNVIFQHRNLDKWDILGNNLSISGFQYETDCREFISLLRSKWDGGSGLLAKNLRNRNRPVQNALRLAATMITCLERENVRIKTLESLKKAGWDMSQLHIEMDAGQGGDFQRRQCRCAFLALKSALRANSDYILFLEDDLIFNRFLHYNLSQWGALRERAVTLASLYNPRIPHYASDVSWHSRITDPHRIFGSQAFVLSASAAKYVVSHWNRVPGMQDIKISRLAARLGRPILYHYPSLVQHRQVPSVWGGVAHQAADFDPNWRVTSD